MANIFLKPTAKFNPFSYQEMLAPVKSYTEAYNALEEEMANLDIMAEDASSKLNNPLDKELKQEALGFQKNLKEAMENLYTKGLTPDTRKTFNQLKAAYANKINPINEAYKAYQEDQKYLEKMAIEHPEILIEGAGKSVSDYIGGKSPQMMSVNADDLMNQAMAIAKTQAGRTHRQSNWTPTAGGRFLERTTEVGLNDAEFNLALAYVQNPNLTAKDLNMKEEDFNKVKSNAALLNASMTDIINSPSFVSLSAANKERALNSIVKGVRAGFQYDKKTNTEADPMFAYNLKAQEAAAKAKKDKTSNIGSSTYRAVNLGKEAVSKYLKASNGTYTTSDLVNKFFNSANPDAKLISEKYMRTSNKNNFDRTKGFENEWDNSQEGSFYYQGYTPQYNMRGYKEFKDMLLAAGLNPDTVTRQEVVDRFVAMQNDPDAFGRKRASIVTPDTDIIQTYIEKALNDNTVQEIEGFEKGEDGVLRYKNKESVNLDTLLDDDGKLNILSIDMDYATGERTFTVKDKKGNRREFRIPDDASFESTDQLALNVNTAKLRELEGKIKTGEIIDDGQTLYKTLYGNITASQYREMLQDELDLVFASILNYMGKSKIN